MGRLGSSRLDSHTKTAGPHDSISCRAARTRFTRTHRTHGFGLIFEQHIPETVSLFGLPIRPGLVVQNRTTPEDLTEHDVPAVEGGKATVVPKGTGEPGGSVDVTDLLVVKRFHESVHPEVEPVGDVRRATPDKPAHVLLNGENFNALQLLMYSYAGQVECMYIDPPYNTGDKPWKYNNRFG